METTKARDTAHRAMTLIGKSVVIKGEISCGEDLYIDGEVEGTIDPKGNRLTIGPNGRVKANVTACAVLVQGKLEGNIKASDRVDLKQSAVVTGDIATQRISIDEGAYFKGGVNIQKEPKNETRGAHLGLLTFPVVSVQGLRQATSLWPICLCRRTMWPKNERR
jgi:cytoskeletal protein CcmA (bactofilin family)